MNQGEIKFEEQYLREEHKVSGRATGLQKTGHVNPYLELLPGMEKRTKKIKTKHRLLRIFSEERSPKLKKSSK